ncbi:MAG: cytochrome C oxidase subunit IV family protein [Acidobacteriaceae bacterium]|nr:cytochrome C oxidase subunit IV family protein [Acidobacteriaceae bacterium]
MSHSIHSDVHSEKNDPLNVTNPEHAEHHIVSPVQYIMVYATLLIFTLITVGAAYIDMGAFNPVVALAIATFKMIIVLLFFMHVKYSSRLIKMTISCGFVIFLVLITMTLTDYMSRAWGRW